MTGNHIKFHPPTICPDCRFQRRLAYRCHTVLFSRPAFPNGEKIFSFYPSSAPFPVMKNEDYFKDNWNALDYGKDFDFSRPFFEQFFELSAKVPRYARTVIRTENCDYCNNVSDDQNCFLIFSASNSQDCLYGENIWADRDCLECTNVTKSELCYDCVSCDNGYDLQSSEYSQQCQESYYLAFCKNLKNCFGCVNLRNKQYCIWNEQKTKAEYENFIQQFKGTSWSERLNYRQKFELFMQKFPRPHTLFLQTEACTGNFLMRCKNTTQSAFIQDGENVKYCFNLFEGARNCMDHSLFGRGVEWTYECSSGGIGLNNVAFCLNARDGSSNLYYCDSCDSCQDCFGCISLKKKQYCIFNQQYTKAEYERKVPQIIEHMEKTGEWGEFFPMEGSSIPYNRSLAQRYFPLSQDQAETQKLLWSEESLYEVPQALDGNDLPEGLPDTNQPLTVKSISSQKPFRIIQKEISVYRKMQVPLPRLTYEERLEQRAKKLGGIKLYERSCAKTGKKILTSYPPESPYIIWDRDVYEASFL